MEEENKTEERKEEMTEVDLITLMFKNEREYITLLHILILALVILVAVALFTLYGQYKMLNQLTTTCIENAFNPLPAEEMVVSGFINVL
ncbi:MAG: hypothetical protein K6C41_04160 [Lachnospiraceae bacterium]|nr:hypothetical protein [Lachnospiraceae bacterium]